MSLENGDGSSATEVYEAVDGSQKKAKNLYTRDFLLSLSELEICKKLPSGFNQSILSEFEDASHGIQDRPRVYSSLPFRRNDYSSSPPTRGDSNNISRPIYGRRDNRASGWSDKDIDTQSDLDSDSGRRTYGNQSRQSWQNPEHDGLLGSGSFPRSAGFIADTTAPKGQTNEHYQLNRSNLPYQPPRPFKAVPHSRTSTHDSFNDETFGSNECTSQDKAEEERKRRASFELMRKEQQKVLQEKQKLNANKHINDCFTDLMLEEAKEKESSETNGEPDSANLSISSNDSGKASQSSTSRPLVPPGFRSTALEKASTAKPLISSTEKEQNPKPDIEEIHFPFNSNAAHPKDENSCGFKMGEAIMSSSSGLKVPTEKIGTGDHHSYRISCLPELHEAVDGEVFELPTNKVMGNKIVSNSSQDSTPSILGELFCSAPTNGSSGSIEPHENKPDDSASSCGAHSSKFAQWFQKDVKIPMDNLSSGTPNDLFSLIVSGEKAVTQVPNITSAPPVAAVLTCEDLEQTILSEYSQKTSISHPPVPNRSISDQETTDVKAVDNHATHHLLSLLQKGTSVEETIISSNVNIEKHPKDTKGPNLTLETLFGTDFMKELQSASGSARTDPVMDDGVEPVSDKVQSWFLFDGLPENDQNSLKKSVDGTQIRLPENESLFPVGDSDATFEISEKLAALNSGFRGERFVRGPYDLSNPERQNSLTQMTHSQTMFDTLDSRSVHINAHMRFPEHFRQHDTPNNHQFPSNMLHRPFDHPDTRVTGFNIPANPHMQMQGNFPHHLLCDFPRPSLMPPRPSNQGVNFMPNAEAMHGFMGHRQPNIGGLGMPLSGCDPSSGMNHQEALERMMAKQAHRQAMYGHELDMGFRYK